MTISAPEEKKNTMDVSPSCLFPIVPISNHIKALSFTSIRFVLTTWISRNFYYKRNIPVSLYLIYGVLITGNICFLWQKLPIDLNSYRNYVIEMGLEASFFNWHKSCYLQIRRMYFYQKIFFNKNCIVPYMVYVYVL